MKRVICGALLLFAGSLLAQQQGPPPYGSPPYGTPPTPQEQRPDKPFPPDTKAPLPRELSNQEVEEQINKKLSTEPLLASAGVNAVVDDKSVVLSGTVQDERQHDLALRIAKSYAGEREIVDKIQVQQKT
jgi:hypothetical protein